MRYKTIYLAVFVLALFPYLAFFKTPFDTQPWALLVAFPLAVYLIAFRTIVVPKPLLILMYIAGYALLVYVVGVLSGRSDVLAGLRSLVAYVSIAAFALVGYASQEINKVRPYLYAVGIWFAAALAQLAFGAAAVSHLVSRFSTGGDRGLTALAPEPAFYATYCIALLVLNEVFYREERYGMKTYIGVGLLLVAQVVLTYSGVGMLLLVLFGGAKLLELIWIREERRQKYLAAGALAAVLVSCLLFVGVLRHTRAGVLVHASIENPSATISDDLSVSRRLGNPVLAVYGGLVVTRGIGSGIGSKDRSAAPAWLSTVIGEPTFFGGRIEGGLVSIIYELGIVGVLYIGVLVYIVCASFRRAKKMRPALLASAAAVFLPTTIFGPIAFPLLGYLVGIHLWYLYKK